MPQASYTSDDGQTATLTLPEGYEAPRVLTIPRMNEHDSGTQQQYFYKDR